MIVMIFINKKTKELSLPCYFFHCPHCGLYSVSEKVFRTYVGDDFWKEIQQSIENTSICGAVVYFEDFCPRCAEEGTKTVGTIRAVMPGAIA